MASAQRSWVLSCLVFTLLHQRCHTVPAPEDGLRDTPRHESTTEASTERVTCYTCVNVSNNFICNQFAIDKPCPAGQDFCHTLHIMDSFGQTVIVHKKCTGSAECSPYRVGCLDIDTQKACVSCCDEMYCNIDVPTNDSTATFSDTRTRRKRQQQLASLAARRRAAMIVALTLAAVARG